MLGLCRSVCPVLPLGHGGIWLPADAEGHVSVHGPAAPLENNQHHLSYLASLKYMMNKTIKNKEHEDKTLHQDCINKLKDYFLTPFD